MYTCSTCSLPVKKKAAEVKFDGRQQASGGHKLSFLAPSAWNDCLYWISHSR